MGAPGVSLYAVGCAGLVLPEGVTGLGGAPLRLVEAGGLVAVVSDAPGAKVRPERRHLAAHQNVQRALGTQADCLPVAFGIIVDRPGTLRTLLTRHADALHASLARIQGRVEMTLRVAWDVPNLAAYFVETVPGLREARDRAIADGSHAAKVELGEVFAGVLRDERQRHTDRVLSVLGTRSAESVVAPPKRDEDVLSAACLVDRSAIPEFEAAVYEAASHFDDHFRFDYSGPWAPYSFVSLNLSDEAQQIAGEADDEQVQEADASAGA